MLWDFKQFGEHTAVIDDRGQTLTYAALSQAGQRLCAAVLQDCGQARCLVFNLCSNVMGSLVGYASFLNGGIVPAMLKQDLDEDLLADLYAQYRPAYIWTALTDKERPIFVGLPVVYEAYGYVLLRTPFGLATQLYPELALLLTTSGSTGSPKFVRQSYKNIQANTDSIVEYLQLDAQERPVTNLPMNYTYGISVLNTHLAVGATLLLTDKTMMQRDFWSFCREQHATSLAGVPYTYEMLKRLRFMRMDLPDLHTLTQAGGKLLPELHQEFAAFAQSRQIKFVVMYGACEATARMGWLPPDKALMKTGSMGIAIPGGRFELLDAQDEVITQPDVVGELVYYGDNVTLGYATSAADLVKGDERQGRYPTGDMARRDADGYYYIVGRKKRFLKLYGNRVNLDDCERLLKAAFTEVDVVCGGVDDKLYIFSTDEQQLPQMRRYLSSKTGLNQAAFRTVFLSQIPHNESGKTLYKELAQYYDK